MINKTPYFGYLRGFVGADHTALRIITGLNIVT